MVSHVSKNFARILQTRHKIPRRIKNFRPNLNRNGRVTVVTLAPCLRSVSAVCATLCLHAIFPVPKATYQASLGGELTNWSSLAQYNRRFASGGRKCRSEEIYKAMWMIAAPTCESSVVLRQERVRVFLGPSSRALASLDHWEKSLDSARARSWRCAARVVTAGELRPEDSGVSSYTIKTA